MYQCPLTFLVLLPVEHGYVELPRHQQVLIQLHPELVWVLLLNPIADHLSILMIASATTILHQNVVWSAFLPAEGGFEPDQFFRRIPEALQGL